MNLAVSEDANLLIRQGAFYAVRIEAKVIFVGVGVVFDNWLRRRRVQSLVLAGEVGCLKGLEVFLSDRSWLA